MESLVFASVPCRYMLIQSNASSLGVASLCPEHGTARTILHTRTREAARRGTDDDVGTEDKGAICTHVPHVYASQSVVYQQKSSRHLVDHARCLVQHFDVTLVYLLAGVQVFIKSLQTYCTNDVLVRSVMMVVQRGPLPPLYSSTCTY